jgi:TRAP-type mannitol/chloroaromatic compound transport system substrate-binding protein
MRSFGYGARTLRNLGVATYELPASDIRPAFESGVIDAAEFAMPSIDILLGFPEFAPYLYLPGWQQPSTPLELLILEKTWLALSESYRATIMRACSESLRWTRDVAARRQDVVIADFRAQGVQILEWPDQLLGALKQSWAQVIEAEIAADPGVAMAWRSYLDFRFERVEPTVDAIERD